MSLGQWTLTLSPWRRTEQNHKEVTVWDVDIRDLAPAHMQSSLGIRPGDLDLLAACPPCQGFSTMRTLNGALAVDDPRNDLLLEILRFVDVLRPRAVMIENVPDWPMMGVFTFSGSGWRMLDTWGTRMCSTLRSMEFRNADGGSSISPGLGHEYPLLNLFPTR